MMLTNYDSAIHHILYRLIFLNVGPFVFFTQLVHRQNSKWCWLTTVVQFITYLSEFFLK